MNHPVINNRYAIIKELGHGSMGTVYLAEDKMQPHYQVALKVIKDENLRAENIAAFKKEFQVMSRLKHPNLVRVFDFGHSMTRDNYYITMEYIEGQTLTSFLQKDTVPSPDRLCAMLIDLCRAIDFMHSRNILHRDIKPGNIIITDNKAMLMDFGLSDLMAEHLDAKGTLGYIAPEIFTGNVDYPSDYFALGVTLYELLLNDSFYKNSSTYEIVKYLRNNGEFDTFRQIQLDMIHHTLFKDIIKNLTAYNPADRLRNIMEIVSLINRSMHSNHPLETTITREAYVLGASFIGREDELRLLIDRLTVPDTGPIFIHGEPGVGKSRLMAEFKNYCQINDYIFLEGSCFEHNTRRYSVFIPILSECLLKASHELLETHGPILKKVLPMHEALHTIELQKEVEPGKEHVIIKNTIIDFIFDVCTQLKKTPVLYFNDVQWIDDLSLEAIALLLYRNSRNRENNKNCCLPYFTSRPEGLASFQEHIENHMLEKLQLRSFNKEDVVHYIYSIFGDNKIGKKLASSVPAINHLVGGNPFYLQELIKSLVELKHINRTEQYWELSKTIENLMIPGKLNELLKLRLQRLKLPPHEMRILHILALLNREVTWFELDSIIPIDLHFLQRLEIYEIIKIKIIENQLYYIFYHDLIKDIILASIDNKQELHKLIAEKLEAHYRDMHDEHAEELAYHYYESGNKEKAALYLEKAANQAKSMFENNKAVILYERFLTLIPEDNLEKIEEIELYKGEVYRMLNNWDAANTALHKVIELGETLHEKKYRARAYLILGRYYLDIRDGDGAGKELHMALKLYEELNSQKGILDALNYLGGYYGLYQNNFDKALELHEKSLSLARQINDKEGIMMNIGNIGIYHSLKGNNELTLRHYTEVLEISRELQDKENEAILSLNMSVTYYDMKDYYQALKFINEAHELADEFGLNLFLPAILLGKAKILLELNNFDEAAATINHGLEIITQNKDIQLHKEFIMYKNLIELKKNYCADSIRQFEEFLHKQQNIEDNDTTVAMLHFEFWKITGDNHHKEQARKLLQKLYAKTQLWEYKNSIALLDA